MRDFLLAAFAAIVLTVSFEVLFHVSDTPAADSGDALYVEDSPAASDAPAGSDANATSSVRQLVSGWYDDQSVSYYDFGQNTGLAADGSLAVAPIYVPVTGVDADGNPLFVEGQHNISDVVPGDVGYSDLWRVVMVTVPEDHVPDSLRSKADVLASGYALTQTNMLVNCPFVPAGTELQGGEPLHQGWYRGEPVFYFHFGLNPAVTAQVYVFVTGVDAYGRPQLVDGQLNVIDATPDDPDYSAFWRVYLVTVPADYEPNSIRSADAVRASGYPVTETDIVVNGPVVDP